MWWKLKSIDDTTQITPNQLVDILLSKHMQTNKKEFEVLSSEFAKFMQWKETLHEASILQLILIAFTMGYYYRVFIQNNDVEVIYESNNHQSSPESDS